MAHDFEPRRKESLLANVAIATLVAVICFSAFYVIGAVIGLALIAAVGVAVLGKLVWMSTKARAKLEPASRSLGRRTTLRTA